MTQYIYKDKEETTLKTINTERYEFRFKYEGNDIIVRFADKHTGQPPTTGHMIFNKEYKEWEPYGKWKQYNEEGEIELVVKYRELGMIDYEDWYSEEEGELPDEPNMNEYIPEHLKEQFK